MSALVMMAGTLANAREHVVLLHGLCRTRASMVKMEKALKAEGYTVSNIGYPSRTASIEELSEVAVARGMREGREAGASKVNFVAHSLGGILIRSYFSRHSAERVGRVVMLGPPNRGSELVDRMGTWPVFRRINGPAGLELGSGGDSTPNRLGPPRFSCGVIAGNWTINWINSSMITGPDDGKVSVERTRLEGMADHVVLPVTHPYLMKNRRAIEQTIRFLKEGRFGREHRTSNVEC